MFRLNLAEHFELCEDLKKFISALLPHENGDNSLYSVVLSQVTRLIHVNEMSLEYYLIFRVAEELEKIYFQTKGNPVYTRSVLETTLISNLFDIVKTDGIGITQMLAQEGVPSNLGIETVAQDAMNRLMNLALELYDDAFKLCVSPHEVLGYFVSLKNNYISAIGTECIRAQAFIFNADGLANITRFDGWKLFLQGKKFLGGEGWKDFLSYVSFELDVRLREASTNSSSLQTLEQAEDLRLQAIHLTETISNYGIPPIDNRKPIVRSNYTILIGERGIGKTTVSVNFLVNVFLDGHKCLMINEETPEPFMLYEYLLPVYIFKRFGFFATFKQIIGEEEIPGSTPEEASERRKYIKIAIHDFTTANRFKFVKSINAWRAYDELATIYSEFDFDYCIIDHSLSMAGGGETTPRLESLSKGIKEFKNKFGKHVLLLSHTSPKAARVREVSDMGGLTKYATQLEGDADDVFYIFDNDQLEAKGLLAMVQTKGRGSEKETSIINLTKIFACKLFRYDPQHQDDYSSPDDIVTSIKLDDDTDYSDEDTESDADFEEDDDF